MKFEKIQIVSASRAESEKFLTFVQKRWKANARVRDGVQFYALSKDEMTNQTMIYNQDYPWDTRSRVSVDEFINYFSTPKNAITVNFGDGLVAEVSNIGVKFPWRSTWFPLDVIDKMEEALNSLFPPPPAPPKEEKKKKEEGKLKAKDIFTGYTVAPVVENAPIVTNPIPMVTVRGAFDDIFNETVPTTQVIRDTTPTPVRRLTPIRFPATEEEDEF